MASNFINNLKGLIDFSGVNPQLMATPADIQKVITPQYQMATPADISALTSQTPEVISLEEATSQLPRVNNSAGITGGNPGQKLRVSPNSKKIIDTTKDIANLFDNPVGGKTGKVTGQQILNYLKTAARPTSRIGLRGLGPVGAILGTVETVKDVYNLGKAIVDNYNVNKDYNEQAYQEAQFRQMRRAEGKTTPEIDAELEELKARKAASDAEVLKQQALTDKAKANYDTLLAAQQQPTGGAGSIPPVQNGTSSNSRDIPPEGSAVMAPIKPTTLDYTDLSNLGNYGLNPGTPTEMAAVAAEQQTDPVEQKLINDVLNQQNPQNQEQIKQALEANYAQQLQAIQADPRYQGGVITPDNPYNANINDTQRANRFAEYYTAFTNPSQLADVTAQNAERLYQQQLANQAGVPYADYIAATTEQRAQQIQALGLQRENILYQQAQQATNMKEKLAYLQEMRKNKAEMEKALVENQIKGEYDLQKQLLNNRGSLDVAQTNAAVDMAIQQSKVNDPSRQAMAYAQLGETVSYMPEMFRGQYLFNLPYNVKVLYGIQNMSPVELQAVFGGRAAQVQQPTTRPTFGQRFNEFIQGDRNQ